MGCGPCMNFPELQPKTEIMCNCNRKKRKHKKKSTKKERNDECCPNGDKLLIKIK